MPPRKDLDLNLIRSMLDAGMTRVAIAHTLGVGETLVLRHTRQLKEGKGHKPLAPTLAPIPRPNSQTISPAMLRLAQFDPLVAACVEQRRLGIVAASTFHAQSEFIRKKWEEPS